MFGGSPLSGSPLGGETDVTAGVTAVSSDGAAAYSILAAVSADGSAAYAIRAAVSADGAAAYTILAVSAVASDGSAAYAIRALVAADGAAAYVIQSSVAADGAAAYNIISVGAVSSDGNAAYVIRSSVVADAVASYSISTGSTLTAADIAARVRVELAAELAYIMDLAKIHALVLGTSLAVTPSSRIAGSVVQAITGDGITNTTITRSP